MALNAGRVAEAWLLSTKGSANFTLFIVTNTFRQFW